MSDEINLEKRIIKCDLTNSNLFNCILNNLEEDDLQKIKRDPSKYESQTILNCLGAGIITCLRIQFNEKEIKDFLPSVEFTAERNEQGFWRFKTIRIIANKQLQDDLIFKLIERCLKFIKTSCQLGDKVDLTLVKLEDVEDFKQFKLKILEMKDWLHQLTDDTESRKKLFDSLENIADKV